MYYISTTYPVVNDGLFTQSKTHKVGPYQL